MRDEISVPFKSFLGGGSQPFRLLNDGRVITLFDPLFFSAWSDIIDFARTRSRSHMSRSANVVFFGNVSTLFSPHRVSIVSGSFWTVLLRLSLAARSYS